MVCVSFFECVFTNSFVVFGLVILFVTLYYRSTQDVFKEVISVKFWVGLKRLILPHGEKVPL